MVQCTYPFYTEVVMMSSIPVTVWATQAIIGNDKQIEPNCSLQVYRASEDHLRLDGVLAQSQLKLKQSFLSILKLSVYSVSNVTLSSSPSLIYSHRDLNQPVASYHTALHFSICVCVNHGAYLSELQCTFLFVNLNSECSV